MKLHVKYLKHYGKDQWQAADEQTREFLEIFGRKSLTLDQIKKLHALGFEITRVSDDKKPVENDK